MYELYDFITTKTTISCMRCEDSTTVEADEFDAVDSFYENGWRIVELQCLCKKCVEKLNEEKV
jgi:hypothetical protein